MNCSTVVKSSKFHWKDSTPRPGLASLKWLSLLMVELPCGDGNTHEIEAAEMADRAMLFKLSSKQLGARQGLLPSFMAKPHPNLPGTSGHVHVSLVDEKTGRNLFAREKTDPQAEWEDIKNLSDLGRHLYETPGLSRLTAAWPGYWKVFQMYFTVFPPSYRR